MRMTVSAASVLLTRQQYEVRAGTGTSFGVLVFAVFFCYYLKNLRASIMKNIYEHYKANPPLDANGNRKRGNSSQDGYWTGYDFPDRAPRGEAGSNARLAWEAGKLAQEKAS